MRSQYLLVGVLFAFLWGFNDAATNASIYQLAGTWIVRNSSDVSVISKCPFVTFNTNVVLKNANMSFISKNNNFTAVLKPINATVYEMFNNRLPIGNFSLLISHLPDYAFIKIETFKDREMYHLLTHELRVPVFLEREIANVTKNIMLYSTNQGMQCSIVNIPPAGSGSPIPHPVTNRPPIIPLHPANNNNNHPTNKRNSSNKIALDMLVFGAFVASLKILKF